MLLHSLYCSPLCSAMYAFSVSEDDEMQIFEKGLEIDYEMFLMRDEQPMRLLHVYDAVREGGSGNRAEEALPGHKW